MNSKWQLCRVGLVNFWYYDEEEFSFLDGRMLLRGANGSGKSVTMQSFIPLLLDGNMRPERLDPFGSRARKMENYLLEEGDRREERTGYLYMELKREDSETFLTFGIGMRARKNKKMDVWYFYITDNRRIGRDFFLYKESSGKIPCSIRELKYRIGEGGKVMETQREYAAAINRLLFGFETQEEYKELLELLIQLRTPKLSKDFKPTVINEILSSSLQTLSEDDLRPMSEAIENMDAIKTNLDSLKEAIRGAEQIEKIYRQYVAIVLYEKAALLVKTEEKHKSQEKEIDECRKMISRCREEREKEERHYEALEREEKILLKERDSLKDSDAAKLKEEEIAVRRALKELENTIASKKRQEEEKRDRQREIERRLSGQTQKNELVRAEIDGYLDEMEAEIEGVPFDEFVFMRDELTKSMEETGTVFDGTEQGKTGKLQRVYDFTSHNRLLKDYTDKVKEGKTILEKERDAQETYSRFLQELEREKEERNKAERELLQYESLLHEVRQELIEQIYRWEKENHELHPEAAILQEISRRIEEYHAETDYWEVKNLIRETFDGVQEEFSSFLSEKNWEKSQEEKQFAAIKEELALWKKEREPEPEISAERKENRRLLKERGIPYTHLYKIIDFDEKLDEKQKANLEEALLRMGILSALIVPAEYREEVLSLNEGTCDQYIFQDVQTVKENLLSFFAIDNPDNDILLYQRASAVLSAIGWGGDTEGKRGVTGGSWIDGNGNYGMGILTGTITGNRAPCFIGRTSRERYRLEKIRELEKLCREQEEKIQNILREISEWETRKRNLVAEWAAFPSDRDIKVAARDVERCENRLSEINEKIQNQMALTEKARKTLDDVRLTAQEICKKCYLPTRLSVFADALVSLENYGEVSTKLQIAHGVYVNGLQLVRTQEEYMEEALLDLDNILYDIGRVQNQRHEERARLSSIEEQLALTDYEQMKERLSHCLDRLSALPGEKEKSVETKTNLRNEEKFLTEKLQEEQTEEKKTAARKDWLVKVFLEEYRLSGEFHEKADSDAVGCAKQIAAQYEGAFANKKQSNLLGSLQEVYHKNRGYLQEYHLTLQTMFEESEAENPFDNISVKRIGIYAKYRGTSVPFGTLLAGMREDKQIQSRLLSDKDRELFEDILANTISKKIRARIYASKRWVEKMNNLMASMKTSSGLTLNLRWKNKKADSEEQLDTRELVELLQKDVEIMRPEETEQLSKHFRSKIEAARREAGNSGNMQSFHAVMREVLDYRKWFEFQLECRKIGEKKKELTDRVFFTFSGGEKAMAMYVPLFSAVVAKYAGARKDAPRLISLDEAFAGVDETNIRDMFRLMVEFDFNFMINSQILWGDYDTVPGLAIYQLIRPENVKYVTVIRYIWNGTVKKMVTQQDG